MEVQAKKLWISFTPLTGIDDTKYNGSWLLEAKFWVGAPKVDTDNVLELAIECGLDLLDLP